MSQVEPDKCRRCNGQADPGQPYCQECYEQFEFVSARNPNDAEDCDEDLQ